MSDLTLRRSIAALMVWVLLAALGAGAGALVADDISATPSAEQAEGHTDAHGGDF